MGLSARRARKGHPREHLSVYCGRSETRPPMTTAKMGRGFGGGLGLQQQQGMHACFGIPAVDHVRQGCARSAVRRYQDYPGEKSRS
jgi:hypothetical protein